MTKEIWEPQGKGLCWLSSTKLRKLRMYDLNVERDGDRALVSRLKISGPLLPWLVLLFNENALRHYPGLTTVNNHQYYNFGYVAVLRIYLTQGRLCHLLMWHGEITFEVQALRSPCPRKQVAHWRAFLPNTLLVVYSLNQSPRDKFSSNSLSYLDTSCAERLFRHSSFKPVRRFFSRQRSR